MTSAWKIRFYSKMFHIPMASSKLFIVSLLTGMLCAKYMRVCYYTNWSQYRYHKFLPQNVNPDLCSHIIVAFAKLIQNQMLAFEWNDETTNWTKGTFENLVNLKIKVPTLKVMIAVGGWAAGTDEMTKMLASSLNRTEFVNSSIEFIKRNKLDGLDLYFMYPGHGTSPPEDKERFSLLLKEISEVYTKEKLLLSATVAAQHSLIDKTYELDKLENYLDFINVMTYDFHGQWDSVTGHNSPLYSEKGDFSTIDWAMNKYVKGGVSSKKLLIGVSSYGRCFVLTNQEENGIGAAVSGSCLGRHTQEEGIVAYYEVCIFLQEAETKTVVSEIHGVPYLIFGTTWITYDDVKSLVKKVEYIKKNNFGGWFFWDLSFDDYMGVYCGRGKYPLLKTLNEALKADLSAKDPNEIIPPYPAPEFVPKLVNMEKMYHDKTVPDVFCDALVDGNYPHPFTCNSFVRCRFAKPYIYDCPSSLLFDVVVRSCNWQEELTESRRHECLALPSQDLPSYHGGGEEEEEEEGGGGGGNEQPPDRDSRTDSGKKTITLPLTPLDKLCVDKKDGRYTYGDGCKMYLICLSFRGEVEECLGKKVFDDEVQECMILSEMTEENRRKCQKEVISEVAKIQADSAISQLHQIDLLTLFTCIFIRAWN